MELVSTEKIRPAPAESSRRRPRREGARSGPRTEELSRLRQRLESADGRRAELLQQLTRPGWMLAGSLVTRRTVCGKPNCRCARGQRHGPQTIFMYKEGGRRRSVVVQPGHRKEVLRRHGRYRGFRAALRELKALEQEIHGIAREIAIRHHCRPPCGDREGAS